jgi:arylsulfatase A-like enzyme
MRRRELLGAAAASLVTPWITSRAWSANTERRPNFVVIVADDMGWADVGCYGRDDVRTPAIDSLARDGMKFEQAYANSPVCTPSRVAMITGRYQNRLPIGQEEPLGPNDVGLDPGEPSLPAQLRAAGYQTSLVGKWHMGSFDKYSPLKNGYQHFWGIRGGGADYFTHTLSRTADAEADVWDGDVRADEVGYMTDLLGQHGANEIARMAASRDPFLLSLHFTAPHWPWEGPNDQAVSTALTEAMHHDGGTIATYREMIESLDRNIALVLEALKKSGKAKDTLVLFTSDNGGERFAKTWPFNGMKGELLEGGIRVPLLVRWPWRVRAGSITQQTAMNMDFLPTLLDAAGATPDRRRPPDGVSLLPTLRDASHVEDRTLFWRYHAHSQGAVRRGQYKYLRIENAEFLFDVVADPQERGNLNKRQEAVFRELKDAWTKWDATMLPYTPQNTTWSNKQNSLPDRY